jgi:hypothetical protein
MGAIGGVVAAADPDDPDEHAARTVERPIAAAIQT